ncbi:MAG: Uma2 family endonuclease [Cyanobacteria bacterium P01_A01_bin.114]
MTVLAPLPAGDRVQLTGISWATYETLRAELDCSRRGFRLSYYQGDLEIMAPSPEHERFKKAAGRFVETLAEELEIQIEPFGSTTLKRAELAGTEPDECFYVSNLTAVRGLKRLDLSQDPPPDLAVEIDITNPSSRRLPIYESLGVAEVWRFDGEQLQIYSLGSRGYIESKQSLIFPMIPVQEIAGFLCQVTEVDYLTLVKLFRQWVRRQIG